MNAQISSLGGVDASLIIRQLTCANLLIFENTLHCATIEMIEIYLSGSSNIEHGGLLRNTKSTELPHLRILE